MPDVRLAIRCRRSVIEHIDRIALILIYALLKDPVVLPELCCLLFPLYKVQICIGFLIHIASPSCFFLVKTCVLRLFYWYCFVSKV